MCLQQCPGASRQKIEHRSEAIVDGLSVAAHLLLLCCHLQLSLLFSLWLSYLFSHPL